MKFLTVKLSGLMYSFFFVEIQKVTWITKYTTTRMISSLTRPEGQLK
jgi:hypothetical protein